MFKNFFCGMCKIKRPNEMKTKIIIIDSADIVNHGSICAVCNAAIKNIFNTRKLQTNQITLLADMGIKIE